MYNDTTQYRLAYKSQDPRAPTAAVESVASAFVDWRGRDQQPLWPTAQFETAPKYFKPQGKCCARNQTHAPRHHSAKCNASG